MPAKFTKQKWNFEFTVSIFFIKLYFTLSKLQRIQTSSGFLGSKLK